MCGGSSIIGPELGPLGVGIVHFSMQQYVFGAQAIQWPILAHTVHCVPQTVQAVQQFCMLQTYSTCGICAQLMTQCVCV